MGWLSGGVAVPHQPDTKGALLMSHANAALTPRARVRVALDCWVFFGQCLFCVSGCLLQVQEIAFDLVGSAIP